MNLPQRNLAGGELSPSLYARTDILKYSTGLRTLKNFQIMKSGGVQSRPGTRFLGLCETPDKATRLIPYVFRDPYVYALEFYDGGIKIRKPGSNIPVADSGGILVESVTSADPAVFTATAHGLLDGDEVAIFSWSIGGKPEGMVNRTFLVANKTDDTFRLEYIGGDKDGDFIDLDGIDTSTPIIFISKIVKVTTPYDDDELFDIQYFQSEENLILLHPDHPPAVFKITDFSPLTFQYQALTFTPSIAAPTGLAASGSGSISGSYVVTAIAAETYEESVPSASVTATNNTTLTWTAVSGAVEYNVYKLINGVYGLVYIVGTNSWAMENITPDRNETPPVARDPFTSDYPACGNYIQQRLVLAGATQTPQTCYLSRTALFSNFTIRSPIRDDDAVTFKIAGREYNPIRHVLDLGRLVLLSASGEWVAEGGGDGVLTPFAINLKQQSYHGSSRVRPVIVGKDCLFVQARNRSIRSLGFSFDVDGYTGNDLTIFSKHLFDDREIKEICFQEIPNSIVWAVMNDGKLLGMTYVKEHQMFGWHRHETDGDFESICTVSGEGYDITLAVVKRIIDDQEVRYIEQFVERDVSDIRDFVGSDCSQHWKAFVGAPDDASYPATVGGAETVTLSTGTDWTMDDTITITKSALNGGAPFTAAKLVDKELHLIGDDGEKIRFSNLTYVSGTVITATPNRTIPESLRGVAIDTWTMAFNKVPNLWYLEGKTVSILADGFVVGSPNNASYTEYTVTNGEVTLDGYYSSVIVGLPFLADLETLDIDTASGQSIVDKKKLIQKVNMHIESSRGVWVGAGFPSPFIWKGEQDGFWVGNEIPGGANPLEGMNELQIRQQEGYDDPVRLATEAVEVVFESHWNSHGRIAIRQVDPLPLSVLSIIPSGWIPIGG